MFQVNVKPLLVLLLCLFNEDKKKLPGTTFSCCHSRLGGHFMWQYATGLSPLSKKCNCWPENAHTTLVSGPLDGSPEKFEQVQIRWERARVAANAQEVEAKWEWDFELSPTFALVWPRLYALHLVTSTLSSPLSYFFSGEAWGRGCLARTRSRVSTERTDFS